LWSDKIGKITGKVKEILPRGITSENSDIPGETVSLVPGPNVSLPYLTELHCDSMLCKMLRWYARMLDLDLRTWKCKILIGII